MGLFPFKKSKKPQAASTTTSKQKYDDGPQYTAKVEYKIIDPEYSKQLARDKDANVGAA